MKNINDIPIYPSLICEDDVGKILIVDKTTDNLWHCMRMELGQNSNGFTISDSDLISGRLSGSYNIQIEKTINYKVDTPLIAIAALSNSSFEKVMRFCVKAWSRKYHSYCPPKMREYIAPSGKLLDENELMGMIDASLDMWLTAGHHNDDFEKKLSSFIGVKYALTVNSGSSANLLAISALTSKELKVRRLRTGDEVITTACCFPTTVGPILQNGLVPVFVDTIPGTYNIDPDKIEEAITNKTKAIFVAHTLGSPLEINKILKVAEKHRLWVVEDNCDALGSRYQNRYTGSFGDIATCSFYPAHHITMGEGGAVLTKDPQLYRVLRSLRDWGRDCWCEPGKDNSCNGRFTQQHGRLPYGYDHKYVYSHVGYNLKITDWQAAIGLAQLEKLPDFIKKRQNNFDFLYDGLKPFSEHLLLPMAAVGSEPSWFGFPISVKSRRFSRYELISYLEKNGIGTRLIFAGNILRQPLLLQRNYRIRVAGSEVIKSSSVTEVHYKMLPGTDFIMNNTFWIGVWPGIDKTKLEYIVETFRIFISKYEKIQQVGKKEA